MKFTQANDYIIQRIKTELSDKLLYHSLEHTLSVIESSKQLAERFGVHKQDLKLLLTAAAYHDSGFILSYKNHEQIGCEIASEHLPKFEYSASEVAKIKSMILATKIPQSPETLLEKILCDSDLEYLGQANYTKISQNLCKELALNGVELSQQEWLNMQISFLESHHYWTDYAIKNLAQKKQIVLETLRSQI